MDREAELTLLENQLRDFFDWLIHAPPAPTIFDCAALLMLDAFDERYGSIYWPMEGEDMTREEIEVRFTYHPAFGDQAARYIAIREAAKELALLITNLTPDSREQSLALTALEEVVMWANAGIARREKEPVFVGTPEGLTGVGGLGSSPIVG